MRFSQRTAWSTESSTWAATLSAKRQAGAILADLTTANPTAVGLGPQSRDHLLALAEPAGLRYTPDPLGMVAAREAVARYYAGHAATLSPGRICLTTSTSEAYSFLFRLLCDPGDEVLIASPSYPLFDLLARLDDVVLREYSLFHEPGAQDGSGWHIDLHALEQAITPRTRALVVVHPNNPTGNYVSAPEREALRQICGRRGLALIVDEVFLDYALTLSPPASFAAEPGDCLCFVLSGLSKICAMPQAKLSWIAALGPATLVREACERLEVIADTFLSVSGPTQHALPHWLAGRRPVQAAILARMEDNLRNLDRQLAGTFANPLPVQGGWTVVLRVPRTVREKDFAVAALDGGVIVQPGELYGLGPGRCVLSLLTEPATWARGLERLPIQANHR